MKRFSGVMIVLLFVSALPVQGRENRIKLATTTSTENSGLLDVLLPPFEREQKLAVHVIAVGTGKAIALAQRGDVDVILVHAPEAEKRFVREGYGVNRRKVMHNDFVILGPKNDPAGIKGMKAAAAALKRISGNQALCISRGDNSGTHKKEMALWKKAGIEPAGKWYLEVGQGMGAALIVANQKQAYILCDRGTYLAFRDKIDLSVLVEGDPGLFNPYGIIAVNPAKHPYVKYREAMMLIAWVTSIEGQKIIGGFKKAGKVLFQPDAVPAKYSGP